MIDTFSDSFNYFSGILTEGHSEIPHEVFSGISPELPFGIIL